MSPPPASIRRRGFADGAPSRSARQGQNNLSLPRTSCPTCRKSAHPLASSKMAAFSAWARSNKCCAMAALFAAFASGWPPRMRRWARGFPPAPAWRMCALRPDAADFSFSGGDAELADLVRALVNLASPSAPCTNFPRNSKNCICGFRARKHHEPGGAPSRSNPQRPHPTSPQAHARRRRNLRRGVHRRLHLVQPSPEPKNLLEFLLGAQATALTIGGGIYCLLSIHREKDLNTFRLPAHYASYASRTCPRQALWRSLPDVFHRVVPGADYIHRGRALSPECHDVSLDVCNPSFEFNRLARFGALDFAARAARCFRRSDIFFLLLVLISWLLHGNVGSSMLGLTASVPYYVTRFPISPTAEIPGTLHRCPRGKICYSARRFRMFWSSHPLLRP